MNELETVDRWIEALQILAGDADNPTDEQRAEMTAVRRKMLDTYAHGLAEQQRTHIPYGSKNQLDWHRHVLYGMAGETFEAQQALNAFEQGMVKELTDLIDPLAAPAGPDEEPTSRA